MPRITIIPLLLFVFAIRANAQFYNGHSMVFGKNRVQYRDFFWQHYDFKNYKVFYHQKGDNTARYTGLRAHEIITEMEYRLDYRLNSVINFIVYNDLLDFRQSNIKLLSGKETYNIGGVTNIANNKVMIYNYGDHFHIDEQIRKSVVELLINDILVGNRFTDRLANSALMEYPEWYLKGLIAYYGNEFDANVQASIKNELLNGKYKKLHWLTGRDAELAGFSFWTYIAMNYGEPALRDIMYLSRINKNINNSFMTVTGIPFRHLIQEWSQYNIYRYQEENQETVLLQTKSIQKRIKKNQLYQNFTISPSKNLATWSRNKGGKVKLFLYNINTNKKQQIFKFGNDLPQKNDTKYPIVKWLPTGTMLTWVYEHQQQIKLCFYDLKTKKIQERNVQYIDRILDYDFNKSSTHIVLSAVKNGKTDLFTLNLATNEQQQLTNDLADDLHPKFTENGSIIFSSNRKNNSGKKLQNNYDLICTPTHLFKPTRVHKSKGNETFPLPFQTNKYLVLSDESGISNRYLIAYDSSIQFIDTAIHYRYFSTQKTETNLKFGIYSQTINQSHKILATTIFENNKYQLNLEAANSKPLNINIPKTEQRAFFDIRRTFYNKQMKAIHKQQLANDTLININNYIFEFEKNEDKNKPYPAFEEDSLWVLKRKLYFTTFYTNYTVNQIDFSQLNQSYQIYTGGAVYFNPGFNVLTKFGAADLFEDYKLTAGFRLAANFTGNEYLISIENVKKRLDKQLILHRMGAEEYTENAFKRSYSYLTMLVLKYPFSQVSSVRLSGKIRLDQIIYPAIDNKTLIQPDDYRLWGGALAEYVYDNTKSIGLNLFKGTRAKIFLEQYSRLEKNVNSHMFVIGTDVRHYIQIHRQLIWANRFAASTSFGNAKLIYYLGGVDNWMSVTGGGYFDQTIPVDTAQNWAFQTVATNMRGFQQNIRNGNSFAVINSEIRWPVIKYIFNRPLNSDILDNLMIAGFFDVGSAWYGWNITNKDNYYRYNYIENGPISVRRDQQRDPLVAGYGFGVRTRIFGYYLRFDWAWGIESKTILDRKFYFSINLDF